MEHRIRLHTPEGPREERALEPSLQEGLPSLEMKFPLGEGYLYSNWGIRLASLVAEKFKAIVDAAQ